MNESATRIIKSLLIVSYRIMSKVWLLFHYTAELAAEQQVPTQGDYFVRLASTEKHFNMALSLPGQIEVTIARHRQYEPHITAAICAFMQKDGIFLDIGANVGYHSLYVAAAFESAICICFEPHPTIYQQLCRNIYLNRSLGNLQAHEMAVGDRCGEINFYLQNDASYNRGLSSIHHNYDIGDEFTQTKVKIASLDDFLSEEIQRKVSVVKIDTQGSEDQVILGALETIKKSKPVIIFEFVSDYTDSPQSMIMSILEALPEYSIWKIKHWVPKLRQNPSESWFPELQTFDPLEVLQAKFWSDLICLPKDFHKLIA